jgi:hypothetical protein
LGFEKKRATLTADYRGQMDTLQAKIHVADENKDQPGAVPLVVATPLPPSGSIGTTSLVRSNSNEHHPPARAIEILRERHQREVAELSTRFEKSVALLVQAYDT